MSKTLSEKSEVPFLIIRLWPQHHQNESDTKELLAALKRYRGACDEVWFCTEPGFPPLEVHARSAKMMAKLVPKIRDLGIKPGLQIANTLGHGLSLLLDDSGANWPLMMDANGNEFSPTPCPRSKIVLSYIASLTNLYAQWQPSSIWIDDDLRMSQHGPLKYGCFCKECLKEFSEEQKKKYNRNSLIKALHQANNGSVRLAWSKFNSNSLAGIGAVVAKATKTMAPDCRLGFQQIGHEQFLYSGSDWSPTLKALAQNSQGLVGARLGHGYYNDHSPRQMINKAFMISRQISRLPDCVDQICPEIEGYNHNAFCKTPHGIVVESSLDLAMGCNSLSYAIICSGHEPMSWYETLLSRIADYRTFWKKYVESNINAESSGIEVRLGMDHVQRPLQKNELPFAWASLNMDSVYNLASMGLPLCTKSNHLNSVILHSEAVMGLSDKELRLILAGGVMMDGLAAIKIQARGLGNLLGAKIEELNKPLPFREKISENKLNGICSGKQWNAYSNNSGAFMIKPVAKKVQVLGYYEDRLEKKQGVATALIENASGGRVAIFGYYGWENSASGAKRNQYLTAADWISRNKLPVVMQTVTPVMVVPRVNANGKLTSVFLLNASIDATPPLELVLRGVKTKSAKWLTPMGKDTTLKLTGAVKEKIIKTPAIPPWSVAYISF